MRRASLRAGWLSWASQPRRGRCPSRQCRSALLELMRLEDRAHPNDLLGLGALPLFGMNLSPLAATTADSPGDAGTLVANSGRSGAASPAALGWRRDDLTSLQGASPLTWPASAGPVSLAPSVTTADIAPAQKAEQGFTTADSLFGFPSAEALLADPLGGSDRPHLSGAGPQPNAAPDHAGGGGESGGAGAGSAAGPQSNAAGAASPQANAPGSLPTAGAGVGAAPAAAPGLAQLAGLSQASSGQGAPAGAAPLPSSGSAQNHAAQVPPAPPSVPGSGSALASPSPTWGSGSAPSGSAQGSVTPSSSSGGGGTLASPSIKPGGHPFINTPPRPPASVAQTFCNCGCPNAPGALNVVGGSSTGPQVPQSSPAPVRYGDGVVTIAETDLHPEGFDFPWGQTRAWSNGPGYATGGDNGSGWVQTYAPHLLQADGSTSNTLIYIVNGTTAYYYDLVNGSYQPRLDDLAKLTYNSGNDTFTLLDTQGDQIAFSGFGAGWLSAQKGQFKSYTEADGVAMAVTAYTADGHVAEAQRSATVGGQTVTESWLYGYVASGVNAGLLASVTLRTKVNGGAWSAVRQVQYAYYDGTQTYGGSAGDLLTATVEDGSGNALDTNYYRYYTSGQAHGYAHGLKYAFTPDSYDRLTAALGSNVSSLTDAQVAPYADNYFQYDSQKRVTLETAAGAGDSQAGGGLGTSAFSYTASGNAQGTDSWSTKTVVTNPDGSTDTVYTNYVMEVMLADHYDPAAARHWDSFYAYDAGGRLTLAAAPSAVTGYSDSYADLLHNVSGNYQYLNNSSGLLARFDYYGATTATETTAGGVANYWQDVKVQQVQQGTLVPQETWQYYAHAFSGQTVAPVATDAVYRNTDGTGAETYSSAYAWVSGTALLQSETDTAPVVSAAQNGPGAADVTTTYVDQFGDAQWVKDADGYLQYAAYDTASGAWVKVIDDVDTTRTADFTNLPAGWSTPAGGGLHLVTQAAVDALGRETRLTDPNGNVTYTVYKDANHEVRVYRGWNSGTGTPTGPTEVSRDDLSGSYTEALTMTATPHLTGGVPDGTEAVSGVAALSRDYTNSAGQVVAYDAYFNLSGVTYSTAAHIGTLNVNYYETAYAYDGWGRNSRVQAPTGTIYRTVYDSLGRAVSDWVGTNDTPASGQWSPTNNTSPSNMVETASYVYDNNTLGGGTLVGDGNLTQVIQYPGGGAANRVTLDWYDWRDRVVASKSGAQASESDGTHRPIAYLSYDNLDEVTQAQSYDGDGVTITVSAGVPQPPDANKLRAQAAYSYDDQGRVYRTQVYDVNPSNGAVSTSALTTNYYYDHRGDLIAASDPGGLWSKSAYDGAGRDVFDYTTDGAGGTSWAAAGSVASDTVLEQAQTFYDADSNVIETIARQRFHNATGAGPLGSPTSGIGARVYYAANYYDAADRLTASVDVGTNGGAAWTRPSTAPASSDTVLVTTYAYNGAGWVQDVTDPRGLDTRSYYDNLGRVTKSVQDYTGAAEGAENDVPTEYTYDGSGHLLTVQADEPGAAYQRTQYVYGVTTAGGSGVNSNDILAAVRHPDPSTGNPSAGQQDSYTVNALGQVLTAADRNGSTHTYSYDILGRRTSDAVTTLGAGVDGAVRRIQTAYDTQGNPYLVTSYDAASGGNVVNQVEYVFNGLRQLTGEYQSHSGAVVIGSTPEVQYTYTEMAGGANNSRLTSITYPSGYALSFNYNSGLDSNISRLSSVSDSGGVLESYLYLGLGTVVERDHQQAGVNLTYVKQGSDPNANGDGGDQYTGLDRFGRVIDQNWYSPSSGTSNDRFQYGYDRDSNALWRNNLVNAAFGELYNYDSLNQLTSFQRGTLNSTHTGLVGSASHSQSWSPDALGNFTSLVSDGSTQTRTANQQNEYTSISGSGTVSYDADGNTTADGSGNTFVYDAWDELVAVKSGGTTLAAYGYDGMGQRGTVAEGGTTTDLYYSAAGQVLEERQGGVVQARNVWGPEYVNELVLRDQSSQHNGVLDQRLYAQQDANWNVTAVVNTSGGVLERYAFDPYGQVTVMTPNWGGLGSSAYAMAYQWQGERYDWATGLYHVGARDVSPSLMRPLQADPLGLGPDINDYRWERNRPTNVTDPTGLAGITPDGQVFTIRPYYREPDRNYWPYLTMASPGFKVCQRDVQGDCLDRSVNYVGGQHNYVQLGGVDSQGQPLGGTVGFGFYSGGVVPEGSFKPNTCYACERSGSILGYGVGAGKPGTAATDAEILDCIAKYPPRRKYHECAYNCKDWAWEAVKACGLKCPHKVWKEFKPIWL
jgi:RHS repeat-associated protein